MKLFCISSKWDIESVIGIIENDNIEELKKVLQTNFITSNYNTIIDVVIKLNKIDQFNLIVSNIKMKNKFEIAFERCCNYSNYTIPPIIFNQQINVNYKNDIILKTALNKEDKLMISLIFENFNKSKFIPFYEDLLVKSLKLNIVTIVDYILNCDFYLSERNLIFSLSNENNIQILKKITFFKIPNKLKTFLFNYCFSNNITDTSVTSHFISNELIFSITKNSIYNKEKLLFLAKNKIKHITSYDFVIYLIINNNYDILKIFLENNTFKQNSIKLKQLNRKINDSILRCLLTFNKNNFNQNINDLCLNLICVKNKYNLLKYLNLEKLTNSFEQFDYPIGSDIVKKVVSLQINFSLKSLIYLLNQAIFNNLFNSYYTIQLRIPNEFKKNIVIKYSTLNEQIIISILSNGFNLEEIVSKIIVNIKNISIVIDLIEKYDFHPNFDDLIIYITHDRTDIIEYLLDSERVCSYDYERLFELCCKNGKINIIYQLFDLDVDVTFNDYKGICHLIVMNEIDVLKRMKENYDMNDFCDLIMKQNVSQEIKDIFTAGTIMKISGNKINKCRNEEKDLICMLSYHPIKINDYCYYCNNNHIFLEDEWNKWLDLGKENLCIFCFNEIDSKVYKIIK